VPPSSRSWRAPILIQPVRCRGTTRQPRRPEELSETVRARPTDENAPVVITDGYHAVRAVCLEREWEGLAKRWSSRQWIANGLQGVGIDQVQPTVFCCGDYMNAV
jgi:hypothetical protein